MIGWLVRKTLNYSLKQHAAKAERQLERLQEEAEERQERLAEQRGRLESQFQERVDSFQSILERDKDFYEQAYPLLHDYIMRYMTYQQIALALRTAKLDRRSLQERRGQLTELLAETHKDIVQLEDVKELLVRSSDYGPHLELARMQNVGFPNVQEHEGSLLKALDQYQRHLLDGDSDEEGAAAASQSMHLLTQYIQEKSSLLKDLQFVKWVIVSKRSLMHGWRKERTALGKQMKEAGERIEKLTAEESQAKAQAVVIAAKVWALWEGPLEELEEELEELNELTAPFDDYKSSFQGHLQRMRSLKDEMNACYQNQNYDRLDSLKNERSSIKGYLDHYSGLMEGLKPYYQRRHEVRSEIREWRGRRRAIIEQMKHLQIRLLKGEQHG
ncbi:hypothetical protein MO973_18225 [Paenibacillus sp. TRM 82003]|nr:hypothetical protein [Paenibacillus sp. TRM 82003]